MLLQGGEGLLRSAYAVLDPSSPVAPRRGPGVLYLTNHRLLFELPESRGPVRDFIGGRDTRLALDCVLHDVRNLTVRRGRLGRPRLVVELAGGRFAFDVLEPDAWMAEIARAKVELPSPGIAGTAVTHTIEREVVKIRCRFCGALGNEVHGRCPACGAPL
jgi:hypothetical protein